MIATRPRGIKATRLTRFPPGHTVDPMKAYILPSRRVIQPFGDPVGQAMIGNRTLAEAQRSVLVEAGLEPVPIDSATVIGAGPCLVTYDDVFFTRRVLASLLEQRAGHPGGLRCGLPADSLLVERTRPLQDLPEAEVGGERLALYRLWLVDPSEPIRDAASLERLFAAADPVRARFTEKVLQIPIPANIMGQPHLAHPLTSSVVMELSSWVHVLWANQLSIQIRWVETVLDHKLWAGHKLLLASAAGLLSGRPGWPALKWALASRLNRIGRGCDIHPTARVEFSQLGDGVRVGANALVQGCLVDDGVTIEERACVQYSVVGQGCFVSKNSVLVLCAGYPEGDLCGNGTQVSLFGRKVAVTSWFRIIDVKARGAVKVEHEGELRSTGTNFLGVCFGHGAYGGMDATVQAGRAIPNGAVLVKDPGQVLRRIPADLPPGEPAWARGGRAVTRKKKG